MIKGGLFLYLLFLGYVRVALHNSVDNNPYLSLVAPPPISQPPSDWLPLIKRHTS